MTRIVELDVWTHGAREYAGGWSEYEAERERRRARQYERWEGYVAERERIEEQGRRMQQWEERATARAARRRSRRT